MKFWFLTLGLCCVVVYMPIYARESANKDRHTKERMIRFLNNQEFRFESFIKRCDNQDRLTAETKQKLLDIKTMITNLKESTKIELQKQGNNSTEEETLQAPYTETLSEPEPMLSEKQELEDLYMNEKE